MMIPFLGFVLNWELEFVLRCKERRNKIFGFDLRIEHWLGERERQIVRREKKSIKEVRGERKVE